MSEVLGSAQISDSSIYLHGVQVRHVVEGAGHHACNRVAMYVSAKRRRKRETRHYVASIMHQRLKGLCNSYSQAFQASQAGEHFCVNFSELVIGQKAEKV